MTDVYDVVGVGFGPANMALAIALDEYNDWLTGPSRLEERPGDPIRAVFLEQGDAPRWHPGLLLPDASMQISFLKDLVTFRNPQSRYTFVNFLQQADRLADFVNRGATEPLRVEFSAYLQWVAAQLNCYLRCSRRVTGVHPRFSPGSDRVELFEVTVEGPEGRQELLTHNVVVAAGLQPRFPTGVEPGPRVWHSCGFLDRVEGMEDPRELVVVGSGQSAIEVALDLYRRFETVRVHLVSSQFGVPPSEQGPLVNQIFDPSTVEAVYATTPEVRDRLDRLHRNTNNGSANPREIQAFFDAQYRDRWLGQDRLFLHRLSRLTSVLETSERVRVQIAHDLDGGQSTIDADALVLGTGYRSFDTDRLLGEHRRLVARDQAGRVLLDADCRARLSVRGSAGLYLIGQSDHLHGVSSTLLSNVAVRGGEVADSILSRHLTRDTSNQNHQEDSHA